MELYTIFHIIFTMWTSHNLIMVTTRIEKRKRWYNLTVQFDNKSNIISSTHRPSVSQYCMVKKWLYELWLNCDMSCEQFTWTTKEYFQRILWPYRRTESDENPCRDMVETCTCECFGFCWTSVAECWETIVDHLCWISLCWVSENFQLKRIMFKVRINCQNLSWHPEVHVRIPLLHLWSRNYSIFGGNR